MLIVYIESEKHYQLLYFNTNFKSNIIVNDLNQNNINENTVKTRCYPPCPKKRQNKKKESGR